MEIDYPLRTLILTAGIPSLSFDRIGDYLFSLFCVVFIHSVIAIMICDYVSFIVSKVQYLLLEILFHSTFISSNFIYSSNLFLVLLILSFGRAFIIPSSSYLMLLYSFN